jgi:hypothetical protein
LVAFGRALGLRGLAEAAPRCLWTCSDLAGASSLRALPVPSGLAEAAPLVAFVTRSDLADASSLLVRGV